MTVVGQTGTFFRPGASLCQSEFVRCIVLEVRFDKLLVELEDGEQGEILASDFAPQYFKGAPEVTK